METAKKKIGEILVEAGLIDKFQLSSALGQQRQWGGRLASILIDMGFVDEKSVASELEKQLGVKCVSLKNREIPPEALKIVKHETAKKYCIMPIEFNNDALTLAMIDPTDLKVVDEISFSLGVKVKPVLAVESSITKAIAKHYTGSAPAGKKFTVDTHNLPEQMEIIRQDTPGQDNDIAQYSSETLIRSLLEALIEKKVITREDIIKKIRKK
jgi:type IV pilus assembly protein PilB